MLARRLLCKKQLWHTLCSRVVLRYTQSASQLQETPNLELRLPAPIKKEPERQPFVKNLFLGVFDHEFMYYPEPQTKERHQQFFEWLQPIEKYMSDSLADSQNVRKNDILTHLRDLGVFRAHVNERYLGIDLSQTELAKLVEVLSCFPWLGSYIVKNHIAPTHIISTLASDELKSKYLPKVTTADAVPTICFTEPGNGINMCEISTTAVLSDCETHWILNGEKSFVINGPDSNLFVVFAQCKDPYSNRIGDKSLSVFLVDRDFGGITCKDVKNLAGQHDSPVCTVAFKDTKVPRENLLSETGSGLSVLIDSLAPGNRYIAPQAVGILRTFTKLLTTHIVQRKHLDRNLHEFEAVQDVVGKIATSLYGMESVLYMTTGMVDRFENQDTALEKAMVEAYCANECVACIYEGLRLIGAQSYLRENPYIQIFEDALSYTLFDCYDVDSSTYISLLGLQHTGKYMHKHIFKLRNPFLYPKHIIKRLLGNENRLKLHIAEHLHPSFQQGGEILEKCITKLMNISSILLERHGIEITDRQMELRRMSELAMRTFVLIAALSRASRGYCIGLRNAEQERHLINSFAVLTMDKVQSLEEAIIAGDFNNGDRFSKDIAELMYSKKDYFAEHPLNRTY